MSTELRTVCSPGTHHWFLKSEAREGRPNLALNRVLRSNSYGEPILPVNLGVAVSMRNVLCLKCRVPYENSIPLSLSTKFHVMIRRHLRLVEEGGS